MFTSMSSQFRSSDRESRGLIPVPPPARPHDAAVAIQDWFNPDDDVHLLAWEQFRHTGSWPVGFLPTEVALPPAWTFQLAWRMAERWLRHREDVRGRQLGAE